jgi:hypothetical protein
MSSRQRRRQRSRRQATRSSRKRRLVAAGGLTAGATLAASGVAHAAPTTFTVGTIADPGSAVSDCTSPSNVDCSLREAISQANANAGADTIVFRSGLTGAIDLAAGQLEITDALTIQGPGANLVTVDGGLNSRIIYANTTYGNPVSISGLTLAHGSAEGGGGIRNFQGDLTISNAVITGSYSSTSGGAIYLNYGSLVVDSTTLDTNTAADYGGGVYFYNSNNAGQSVIRESTISGNTVNGDGGGVYVSNGDPGPVLIQNSTIIGNHAGDSGADNGGGVYSFTNPPVITIDSSTITGNSTTNGGGGIFFEFGDTIRNSIVSGNTADNSTETYGPDIGSRPSGLPIKTAFDLIGNPNGAAIDELVPSSNILSADPQLGPLQANGGATQTQLPASTSPAINKGSAFGLNTDQRGLTRPVAFPGVANSTAAGADGADIGAVELQVTSPPASPAQTPVKKKKCKKKKKHKRSAESAKKKCKKKKKKRH